MRVFTHTFGCRVNQYETQLLRERLLSGGGEGVEDWGNADLCVINTCTVTAEADRDAVRLARRIARRNPAARLIVTGCLATRDPGKIRDAAPAAVIVGNADKASIPAMLGCSAAPVDGVTGLDGHARAFVKVQDGCNMSCAFCVIPSIRPRLECRTLDSVVSEAKGLIARGIPELVLCGVRLGRWREGRSDLVALLERLLATPGDFRVRLSSLEVTDATDRLLGLMARSEGKLCPSLHLPLQSGCEATLRRMRRWHSASFYGRRLDAARAVVPGIGLFADVIVGFPGETAEEFAESERFIEACGLDGLHVFRYSPRPGTSAARLPDRVAEEAIVSRARVLRALDARLRAAFARRVAGKTRVVVALDGGRSGLTGEFLTVALPADPGRGLRRVTVPVGA